MDNDHDVFTGNMEEQTSVAVASVSDTGKYDHFGDTDEAGDAIFAAAVSLNTDEEASIHEAFGDDQDDEIATAAAVHHTSAYELVGDVPYLHQPIHFCVKNELVGDGRDDATSAAVAVFDRAASSASTVQNFVVPKHDEAIDEKTSCRGHDVLGGRALPSSDDEVGAESSHGAVLVAGAQPPICGEHTLTGSVILKSRPLSPSRSLPLLNVPTITASGSCSRTTSGIHTPSREEHRALDSGGFFDYLRPTALGVPLYGMPDVVDLKEKIDDCAASSSCASGIKSHSALFARLTSPKTAAISSNASGSSTPMTHDRAVFTPSSVYGSIESYSALYDKLSSPKTAAISSTTSGNSPPMTARPLVPGRHESSAPSTLFSRVLEKKRHANHLVNGVVDDDCMVVSEHFRQHGRSSSSQNGCGSKGMEVMHEFVVPLEPVHIMDNAFAKRSKGGKSTKRARRHAGQKRNEIGIMASSASSDVTLHHGKDWCPVPLADILFQIGENSGSKTKGIELGLDISNAWYNRVRVPGQCASVVGFQAIREVLKCAGIPALLTYVADASWPQPREEWTCLNDTFGLGSGEETCDIVDEALCDCIFRVKSYDDLSNVGGSCRPGEALHVQLCLNPRGIARTLAHARPCAEIAPMHGKVKRTRCVDWRAVPVRKTKKRRRKREDASFRLLDNRGDSLADQPPRFKRWKLRGEQLRSLRWMQQCEEDIFPLPFELIMGQLQVDPGSNVTTTASAESNSTTAENFLGWSYELRCRDMYHIRGGILGDAVGYGKTATMIGLIDSRHGATHPSMPTDEEPYFFSSAATLVLVPSNLLDQWVSEFRKFLDCHIDSAPSCRGVAHSLRIVPIRTAQQLKASSVRRLCEDADVVICSYRLLFSPVYRRRLLELAGSTPARSDADAVRAVADASGLRLNTKRFREDPREMCWKHRVAEATDVGSEGIVEDPSALRFPVLEQFWWRRIVFDEFHELEAMGNTVQFESLKNLCGHYRWGLTGTPPTRDLAQISVLARLFQINDLLQCQETAGEEVARDMAQGFLDRFARQNTGQEALPVSLQEHIIEVHQTAEERAIYLQAMHDSVSSRNAELETDLSTTERLLKLCSHFAYGVGEAASANADTECARILSQKQKHISRALSTVTSIATKLEILWRSCPVTDSAVASDQRGLNFGRECLLQRLRERYSVEQQLHPTRPSELEHAQTAQPTGSVTTGDDREEPSRPMENDCVVDSQACPSALCSQPGAVDPTMDVSPDNSKTTQLRQVPAFEIAVAAMRETRCQSFASLLSSKSKTPDHLPGQKLQPLEQVVRRIQSLESGIDSELAEQAFEDANRRFLAAVEAYDVADRSRRFFENALAATRGEASAEQRTCSICLDEDIPREQLSITSCAHVFHTECIAEVAAKMGTCPICRKSLDAAKDLTALAAEVSQENTIGSVDQFKADSKIAKKFGSKLALMAARLQAIRDQDEKAIVFCQWEDLKHKIASALGAIGLVYFELSGNIYQRSEIIRRFQEESGPQTAHVLLLSLEHSASGTNLTAANHVVFVHPMNATSSERAISFEAQAIGRCRRWGQTKTEVHCWRFVTRGTVEETITADHQRDLWKTYLNASNSQPSPIGGC